MTPRIRPRSLATLTALATVLLLVACTQEQQNNIGRNIQNWTGTDGVLEVYSGNQVVRRFLKVDKLSTATATGGDTARNYRFGYGVFDTNLNLVADSDEKRVYFEVSDYSNYVFFENPR